MFRRKLLRIFLVCLIVAEMTTVAAIGVQDLVTGVRNAITGNFPGRIQYGCPTLQATAAYNNSLVHEILLTCPNGPAVTVSSNYYANYEGPYAAVYPTFSAPPGLLALFAFRPPVGTYYATPCSTGTPPTGYPTRGKRSRVRAVILYSSAAWNMTTMARRPR